LQKENYWERAKKQNKGKKQNRRCEQLLAGWTTGAMDDNGDNREVE
jgi:hypothetical protein